MYPWWMNGLLGGRLCADLSRLGRFSRFRAMFLFALSVILAACSKKSGDRGPYACCLHLIVPIYECPL